jgi:hypothetical protein
MLDAGWELADHTRPIKHGADDDKGHQDQEPAVEWCPGDRGGSDAQSERYRTDPHDQFAEAPALWDSRHLHEDPPQQS